MSPRRPTGTSPLPPLPMLQLLAGAVDGVALSTIVLHVTVHLDLSPSTTGLVLAGAAATAVVVAGPLGVVADRVGLRRAGALAATGSAIALLGYAAAGSLAVYAASAVTFGVAQAVGGAIRQALAVAGLPAEERIAVRATMHTLLNVGLGAGTVVGAGVAALSSGEAFRLAYLCAGLVSIVGAVATLRLRGADTGRATDGSGRGLSVVLRDHRFVVTTALASIVQLTMPVLSVLLPVWVLQHTSAPAWAAGAALAVNALLVITTQRAWTARLTTDSRAATSARMAALALLGTGILLTASGTAGSPGLALLLIGLAAVMLTCGEVAGGAATWAVALRDVPPDAEGRFQSTFSMSSSVARIIGPAVALPLVVGHPHLGWLVLGSTMAAACLGVAHLSAPPTNRDVQPIEEGSLT